MTTVPGRLGPTTPRHGDGLLGRLAARYVVWNADSLLVPADPISGRAAERIVYCERRHLIALYRCCWVELLVCLAGPPLLVAIEPRPAQLVAGLALFAAQLRLLWKIVEWMVGRIIITDRRLIEFGGFLRRTGGSMPLAKLTDLAYRQSLPGLLFDYGTVRVESAGQDQALSRIRYLRHPVAFQQELAARAGS